MALPQWTDQQVFNQMYSGQKWAQPVITYTFPQLSSQLRANFRNGEDAGFSPLNATQQSLIELGMALWNELIVPTLTPGAISQSDIEFGNTNTGIEFAHAYYPPTGSVWFSSLYSNLQNPEVGEYGFVTFIHEIGHALGLNHMGDYNGADDDGPSSYQDSTMLSIMSYYGPNMDRGQGQVAWADWMGSDGHIYSPQTPMLNDIMVIQAMYGAAVTRADDTVYGFGSTVKGATASIYDFTVNLHPILTLYDSGGTDTLNLSGWSTESDVDLRDGHYSSVNGMTNNLAIAHDVVIENAITGAGNDTFIGNAANNYLDGGAGQDRVYFTGKFSDYQLNYDLGGREYTVHDSTGADGTDTLLNIEYAAFADFGGKLNELTPEVYRFFNADMGIHFFTSNNDEATAVLQSGDFQFEGVAYARNVVDNANLVSVYRFFNPATGDHVLTADVAEAQHLRELNGAFQDEGTAFYAYGKKAADTTELYRFVNEETGTHFYTASVSEMESVKLIDGFSYEGVAFYVAMA